MKKEKKVSITMSLEVPDVWEFADTDLVEKELTKYIHSILPRINLEDLSGWHLKFYINLTCTDFVGIAKQLRRYPSYTEYEVFVAIAIPDNSQVTYGMPPAEDGRIGYFHPGNAKYVHLLDPEYEKYNSLYQYILESAIKAINVGFTKGFTCRGKKIKFQDV